jgi:hypothetical protein
VFFLGWTADAIPELMPVRPFVIRPR